MKQKLLKKALQEANQNGRRLVVPLIGFPALQLTESTIKIAQQNYSEHYRVVKSIWDTFKPDAIFPLMDLSVEANALGRYTVFPKEDSATVVREKFDKEELEKIKNIDIRYDTRLLGYVEVQKMMRSSFPKHILRGAYVTGPYTLAGLLLGADEAALASIMNHDYLREICELTFRKILNYIELLIAAGAQMICILEPSAVMLGPEQFIIFSSEFVSRYCELYKNSEIAFIYHICGNSTHLVKSMADAGVDALSLDSPDTGIDLKKIASQIENEVILIGNISPTGKILNGNCHDLESEVLGLLREMENIPNFILSTGCDLPQETPVENITCFMECGRNNYN